MHHTNPQPNDDQLADRTAEVLASCDLEPDASSDDMATAKLGDAIRDSADQALPAASESLRAAVLERLDRVDVASTRDDGSPAARRWVVAAVAATAAGLLIALAVFRGADSRTTFQIDTEPASANKPLQEPVKEPVGTPAESPKFRVETRTRLVPVVKTRMETRTREVPVTLMTPETKTRRVPVTRADGKTELVEQSYTVQVPVQSTRTESYQVSVPYTEQVAQSYTIQVPVQSTRTESYQVSVPHTEQVAQSYTIQVPVVQGDTKTDHHSMSAPFANSTKAAETATAMYRPQLEKFPRPLLPTDKPVGKGWYYEPATAERYETHVENTFATVKDSPISTFSIDVDTASYSNTRRFLNNGQMPPPDSIRIEEFLNYFSYDYPQPEGDAPFSVNMEVAACPWDADNKLLRIGLKGKEIHRDKRPASNLVFLLDVSGSMRNSDKLPLMKQGLNMMVKHLREDDFVSIVTYAGQAGVLLQPTSGDQVDVITSAIDSLESGGSTNGSEGIDRAYELAIQNFVKDGTNRVILATDGDLNVGITDDKALTELIKSKAGEGVFLTVLGFGTGNLQDAKMEKLADNGNGNYAYIDCTREAHKVLVHQMSENLVTIAKDVKLQLEFNPKNVDSYRLIGYENRSLATEDFKNDKKDAGEIGAGHTVTALYELVSPDSAKKKRSEQRKLPVRKYQKAVTTESDQPAAKPELTDAAFSDELLTVKLRHKKPDSDTSKESEFVCKDSGMPFTKATEDFRFAASVAAFGMLLKGSKHAGSATLPFAQKIASEATGVDVSGYRSELVDLIRKATELK